MDFNRLVDVTWIRHIDHKLEGISTEVEDIIEEVETIREHSLASMFELELDMDFELNDRNWLNYIYQEIEDLATDVENIIREVGIQALNHGNRVCYDIQELIQGVRANFSGDHDGYEYDDDEDDDAQVSTDDKDDGNDRDDEDYSDDGDDVSNDDEDELIQEVHANLSGDRDGDDDDFSTNNDDDHEVSTDDVDDEDEDEDGDEVSTDNNDDDVSTDDDDDSSDIYNEDDSSDGDNEDDNDNADESSNDYEVDGNDGSNDDEDDGRDGDDEGSHSHNSTDTAGLSEGNLNVRNEFNTQQLNLALSEGEDLVGEREYPYGNIGIEVEEDSTAIVEENDIAPQVFDDLTSRDIEQLDASTTDEMFHSCDSDPWGIMSDISYESENLTDDEFEKTWELIDDKEVHSIPHQLQGGSIKERILNPFGKKKMLAKEYEELATLFKDVGKEDDQAASETLPATHPN